MEENTKKEAAEKKEPSEEKEPTEKKEPAGKKAMEWLGRVIFIGLGIVILLVYLTPLAYSAFHLGYLMGILLGSALIVYGLVRSRLPHGVHVTLRIVAVAVALLAIVESVCMMRATSQPAPSPATVVVLGCRVKLSGEPTLMLRLRIDAAARYLEEHPEAHAVCCGGMGTDETMSEGECIFRELAARGIDSARLHLEDRSQSTVENIRNAMEIIRQEGLPQELAISTNDYHCYRALQIAKGCGVTAGAISSSTPIGLVAPNVTREWCAILAQWVFG